VKATSSTGAGKIKTLPTNPMNAGNERGILTYANRSNDEEQHASSDGVAAEVQDFYDRHPYPPPVDSLENYRRFWQDPHKRRADHHLLWPALPYREDHSILVAGCGTSQAARYALRRPGARVTGIDFSATSVRCTERLKQKYNLSTLQVSQLPIGRVHELESSFDHIVCTGVLHHLADPDAALGTLRSVLKPGGAMHLMVYAPYGRTGVYMLQDFCRRMGIRATEPEIRDLVAALKALPAGHPLDTLLREAPDFWQEQALADALLHPQDRSYSVPELFDFIEGAGLTFVRWVRQAPYSAQCGVVAKIPQAPRLKTLSLPEQYAAIELFRGTMVRHSIVVYRNDNPGGSQPVSFAGDAWLGYVPVRMPDSICVRDRLPPEAAGVLLNKSHTCRDLFLPIDPTEQLLFDAIDGGQSIGDIVERTLSSSRMQVSLDTARTFFEKLWWYDQVVFDTSLCRERNEHNSRVRDS
jgi:SAM-dependent methyltransferase